MKKSYEMIAWLPWMLLAVAAVDRRTVTRIAAVGVAIAALFYLHHRDLASSRRNAQDQCAALDALPQLNDGRAPSNCRYSRPRADPVVLRAFLQFMPLKKYDPYILAFAADRIDHCLRRNDGATAISPVLDTLSELAFAVPPATLARFNFTGKLRALDVVLARRLGIVGGPVGTGPSDPYSFTGDSAASVAGH